jgi:hypothetical protein
MASDLFEFKINSETIIIFLELLGRVSANLKSSAHSTVQHRTERKMQIPSFSGFLNLYPYSQYIYPLNQAAPLIGQEINQNL